ncbi:hypothetical protein FOZ61_004006 [Perkinsus olseni]|uniref:Uncharacterized protein n=1 Tax=Perkinsus olseni TaxID=32597 RepID=A0A7J6LMJ3_PEROL|nr:hypothetical protein FOZ61_004006 [Perkinsus olseni]
MIAAFKGSIAHHRVAYQYVGSLCQPGLVLAMMSGALSRDRSPPVSPAVSALSATSEASFKSVRGAQIGRGRTAKLTGASRSSGPLVRSWFSKVVSVSVPNNAADDDTPGPFEQLLVVAFAVASSHSEGSLWQQKLYWCMLALAATSLLCVCLVPPGANRKPGGVAAVVGWLPRQVCDFFMLRWPSIIATSLAYRGLVLLAFPMTLGYLLSLVFSCYRFTMYLVYVITYLSFSFPLSTLLLLPVTVIVGPKYLKWILLLLGWSILIYVALSGLIAMYTINNVTQASQVECPILARIVVQVGDSYSLPFLSGPLTQSASPGACFVGLEAGPLR